MSRQGYFEPESIRKRLIAHQLREAGFGNDEIGSHMGLSERHVQRFLSMTKPQLTEMRRNQAWREDAACRDSDTELFFPNSVGLKAARQKRLAIAICRSCPVIEQCREAALANFENHGVWAGEDFSKYRYELDEETGAVRIWIQERQGEPVEKVS